MMKNNIPCEVIKDLLPSYIDDVLSIETKKYVDEHLAGCESCKKNFDNMNSLKTKEVSSQNDINLFRKVKKMMNSKTKKTLIWTISITILLVAFIIFGTTQAVFTVNPDKVEVSVSYQSLEEGEKNPNLTQDEDSMVTITKEANNSGNYTSISLENDNDQTFAFVVDDETAKEEKVVSAVTFDSDIFLEAILWDEERDDEGNVTLKTSGYKTTLNNLIFDSSDELLKSTTTLIFGKVTKILYDDEVIYEYNDQK